uniref:Uncharacterized protein n=1 Tax=Canis lupus dingo TaxID=286419 RepID=A0A8C0LRN2_CANLU
LNPLQQIKLVSGLSEWGAERAPAFQASWHSVYKDSAWIFLGVLRREPTAGDLCASNKSCFFSSL